MVLYKVVSNVSKFLEKVSIVTGWSGKLIYPGNWIISTDFGSTKVLHGNGSWYNPYMSNIPDSFKSGYWSKVTASHSVHKLPKFGGCCCCCCCCCWDKGEGLFKFSAQKHFSLSVAAVADLDLFLGWRSRSTIYCKIHPPWNESSQTLIPVS